MWMKICGEKAREERNINDLQFVDIPEAMMAPQIRMPPAIEYIPPAPPVVEAPEPKFQVAEPGHDECIVCFSEDVNVDFMFDPCGHNGCCSICSKQLKDCPTCRARIIKVIKLFK